MNTALSWIKAYVPELECGDQEYTDAMTLSGTKVETFERLDKNLDKIYVGQILSILMEIFYLELRLPVLRFMLWNRENFQSE